MQIFRRFMIKEQIKLAAANDSIVMFPLNLTLCFEVSEC